MSLFQSGFFQAYFLQEHLAVFVGIQLRHSDSIAADIMITSADSSATAAFLAFYAILPSRTFLSTLQTYITGLVVSR